MAIELALAGLAAGVLTAMMRRHALATHLLDHPNERSSHTQPVPRGGGIAIVVACTALIAWWWIGGRIDGRLAMALLASSLPVALVGYVDDRKPVPARLRFAVHTAGAVLMLALMGGPPDVTILGFGTDWDWLILALATLYLIWMINLVNFMDGIDGIAGVEAITVSLGAALCWWIAAPHGPWPVPIGLAACVAGFLVWNWPPAKIFMGDAGSGFLGLAIAILSLWAAKDDPVLLWSCLILTGAFMTDATVTLARRVLRGEKFYLPHRSHAYQYASRLYQSHKVVTLAFGAVNVLWLLPWALGVALGWMDGALALLIAYSPLVLLAFHYKAGDRAAQGDLA